MNFSELLNKYLKELNCTSSHLANISCLSKSTICRYCNGSRTPNNPSEQLEKLITGLTKISKTNNNTLSNKKIRYDFENILKTYNLENLIKNFNKLITILKINVSDFSKTLGFDASHLSRIRSGERKPSNPDMLYQGICSYIIKNYNDEENKKTISKVINCSIEEINTNDKFKEILSTWLCDSYKEKETTNDINNFLTKLNEFDLNEYIRVIKFDKLKVPTIPFKIPKSKNYYGLEEMKQGEIDFFKSTVLSKSKEQVFMCSDMQMDDMSKDLDFGKKWMFRIAMMLKKGLHLNIIHNLDRPFNELMIGLESWIPIYMTGQVSPFYISNTKNGIYSHLNYVSSSTALIGECIKGYHKKGKYYLTNNKTEVTYYREKSNLILKKAKPLMTIYKENNIKELNNFLNINNNYSNIKNISSSLPIYTIKDNLLKKILKQNDISKEDINLIQNFVNEEKEKIKIILKTDLIEEITTKINKEEFDKFPISLELSKLFYNKKIVYTYEDYLEHFNATKEFDSNNKNYSLKLTKNMAFRNIQISINKEKWVMISKTANPTIHFLIEQPTLCKAIENFAVPIVEY